MKTEDPYFMFRRTRSPVKFEHPRKSSITNSLYEDKNSNSPENPEQYLKVPSLTISTDDDLFNRSKLQQCANAYMPISEKLFVILNVLVNPEQL